MKEFAYYAPKSTGEAIELLCKYKEKAVLMSGGTDVVIRIREKHIAPDAVIDIKKISGINELRFSEDKGLFIGAAVNLNTIGDDENVKKYYPELSEAALSVGSKQVRNRASCIGNICNASPLADTATPLYAYGASVHIIGESGEKIVPINEFIVFVRKTILTPTDIVLGISVPFVERKCGFFQKIARRSEVDLSTVCATVLKVGDETRFAFGSVSPTPLRLLKTEEFLKGKQITDEIANKAVELALSEVSPIDDVRSTKQYRLDMVEMIVRKALSGGECK